MASLDDLIASLDGCPCCGSHKLSTSTAADGIPTGMHFEAAFNCGARVFVTDKATFQIGAGCPAALEEKLEELWDEADQYYEGEE